jgi:hypothetical protein
VDYGKPDSKNMKLEIIHLTNELHLQTKFMIKAYQEYKNGYSGADQGEDNIEPEMKTTLRKEKSTKRVPGRSQTIQSPYEAKTKTRGANNDFKPLRGKKSESRAVGGVSYSRIPGLAHESDATNLVSGDSMFNNFPTDNHTDESTEDGLSGTDHSVSAIAISSTVVKKELELRGYNIDNVEYCEEKLRNRELEMKVNISLVPSTDFNTTKKSGALEIMGKSFDHTSSGMNETFLNAKSNTTEPTFRESDDTELEFEKSDSMYTHVGTHVAELADVYNRDHKSVQVQVQNQRSQNRNDEAAFDEMQNTVQTTSVDTKLPLVEIRPIQTTIKSPDGKLPAIDQSKTIQNTNTKGTAWDWDESNPIQKTNTKMLVSENKPIQTLSKTPDAEIHAVNQSKHLQTKSETFDTKIPTIDDSKPLQTTNTKIPTIDDSKPLQTTNTKIPAVNDSKPLQTTNTKIPAVNDSKPLQTTNTKIPAVNDSKPMQTANTKIPAVNESNPVQTTNTKIPAVNESKPLQTTGKTPDTKIPFARKFRQSFSFGSHNSTVQSEISQAHSLSLSLSSSSSSSKENTKNTKENTKENTTTATKSPFKLNMKRSSFSFGASDKTTMHEITEATRSLASSGSGGARGRDRRASMSVTMEEEGGVAATANGAADGGKKSRNGFVRLFSKKCEF